MSDDAQNDLSPSPLPGQINAWLVTASLLVCAMGMCAGGYFGLLSSLLYGTGCGLEQYEGFGTILGAASGAAVSGFWLVLMRPYATRRAGQTGPRQVIVQGSVWGMLAGVISGIGVHIGLGVRSGLPVEADVYVGFLFGLIVGAAVGLIGGVAWSLALRAEAGKAAGTSGEGSDRPPETGP